METNLTGMLQLSLFALPGDSISPCICGMLHPRTCRLFVADRLQFGVVGFWVFDWDVLPFTSFCHFEKSIQKVHSIPDCSRCYIFYPPNSWEGDSASQSEKALRGGEKKRRKDEKGLRINCAGFSFLFSCLVFFFKEKSAHPANTVLQGRTRPGELRKELEGNFHKKVAVARWCPRSLLFFLLGKWAHCKHPSPSPSAIAVTLQLGISL